MWIMIAGPYRSGGSSVSAHANNLKNLNAVALVVFERGHVPIIGVNLALPITEIAQDNRYDEIMMGISLALVDKCDTCFRVGGASAGADQEVEKFRKLGKPIYRRLTEIPYLNL